MIDVRLDLSDPTIWAKCPKCTSSYLGKKVGDYFAKAFPRRRKERTTAEVVAQQVCENCGGPLEFMYEVVEVD